MNVYTMIYKSQPRNRSMVTRVGSGHETSEFMNPGIPSNSPAVSSREFYLHDDITFSPVFRHFGCVCAC